MRGLTLNDGATDNKSASMVASNGKNVHLDGGTRMLLVAQAAERANGSEYAQHSVQRSVNVGR